MHIRILGFRLLRSHSRLAEEDTDLQRTADDASEEAVAGGRRARGPAGQGMQASTAAHHILVLIVLGREQVSVPRVFQRPPVDLIAVLCCPYATPTTRTILELSALVTATVHLPVAQASESRSSGRATTFGKEIAWQNCGARRSERVAIFVGEPPTAKAYSEYLSEELLRVPHQLYGHTHIGRGLLQVTQNVRQQQLDCRHLQKLLDDEPGLRVAAEAERAMSRRCSDCL